MTFRQLRQQSGVSQKRLAALSGVEQTTISQLDLGKVRDPRWSTISALAVALNVAPGAVAQAIAQTTSAKKSKPKRRIA